MDVEGSEEKVVITHLALARCILWLRLIIADACKLDFIPLGQKCVEAEDELSMAFEKLLDALDDAGRVDSLGFELLHDLQEGVINVLLVSKSSLDLPQVRESCTATKSDDQRQG